ncbi:SH3 domain-containing protein [Clostridium perfringens]|uniref:SH3 domain-containing protein n=3 Tax=Clostridium perfringens TaxID=1502 RepID=UPI0039EAD945
MANNIIPNVSSGDLVGSTPTFPPNAVVRGDFLYLRDVDGNQIPGRTVSDGDEITVLFISNEKNIVLVQYPTSSGYRQGYVTNARSIIKYKDDYSWVNGSTPEPVYDFDKTTQIGTLDPRERAVVLYKVDGMTYVAYDTGKGKLTKSGLVHYEGAGSSTGGGSFNGVAPGEVVPGGFTYENNAEVVGDELYLRDANGNRIPGRSVSVGDRITVLDVSYSKQLALVQYPAGSVVRQGYVTNATNLIRYFKQGEWLNGSTTEPVLDENGGSLGSLSPYEAATPLYKKNGMIHVVYDTSKGPNTKSGYVKFEGLAQLPDTSIQIPSVSHSQATVDVYGTSGKGRPLKVYKIGNGSKVLFAGFAIHGWEDRWDNDGLALVNIANSLISKIGDYKAQNGLHGWTVYIAPCMNPDGVIVRGTNNGPGRCAVKSRIDMNRCFPRGFTAQYNSRNYTGPNPLGAQEAVALKEFIEKINRTADELVVIDGHGWLGCTYGDSSIAQYFTRQFGFSHNGPSGGGYFSYWAQGLPRTRGLLLEYPDTYSYSEVISRNYIGKTFNAIINILKNNPNGKAEDINTNSSTSKWEKKDNKWYYYENGNMVTGWKLVDGKWYYLESNGVMAIGWKELGGIWYYLNESGAMVKGWQTISGKTYYFNDSGHMLLGKQTIDGKSYEFNGSGQLISDTGDISLSESTYIATGEVIDVQTILNVRKGPGTNYDSIGQLHQGDRVNIIAKNRLWYKIKNNSGYGYVYFKFIKIVSGDDNYNIETRISKLAWNTGLFQGINQELGINKKVPLGVLSLDPPIKLEGEVSYNSKMTGNYKIINLNSDFESMGLSLEKELNSLDVTFDFDPKDMTLAFKQLALTANISKHLKYKCALNLDGSIEIILESSFEYDEEGDSISNIESLDKIYEDKRKYSITIYQRFIITIFAGVNKYKKVTLQIPSFETVIKNNVIFKDYKKENIIVAIAGVSVFGMAIWCTGAVSLAGGLIASSGTGIVSELDKSMIGIKFIIHKISEVFLRI